MSDSSEKPVFNRADILELARIYARAAVDSMLTEAADEHSVLQEPLVPLRNDEADE